MPATRSTPTGKRKISFEVSEKTYTDLQLWAAVKHAGKVVSVAVREEALTLAKVGEGLRRKTGK